MDTMQPILRRGRYVWDKINMPADEFKHRVNKLIEIAKKEDIQLVLVYGAGLNDYANSAYLSNYLTRMPHGSVVCIPSKGEVTLIFQGGSRELKTTARSTWINDIKSSMDLPQSCIQYLENFNPTKGKIGVVGFRRLMPFGQYQNFIDGISGFEIVEMEKVFEDLRMLKSSKEHDQIRRASRIVAHGFNFIEGMTPSNLNEKDLETMIDREMRLEGVEDVRILIGKPSEEGWAMRPAENTTIFDNDKIIVYLALSFERYWSEGIRTFFIEDGCYKKVSDESFNSLYNDILGEMLPSKTVSEFYKSALGKMREKNFIYISDYGLGQGIGLSLQESPIFSNINQTQMKSGMCFSVRIVAVGEGRSAIMIGNTILLNDDGMELLTDTKKYSNE
jgi:Xaa-Pro aminopeptidase